MSPGTGSLGTGSLETNAVGAIIVAAGSSRRMGGIDKLLHPLNGRPLIAWTIEPFVRSPRIGQVVIVTSVAAQEQLTAIAREIDPSIRVVLGGERRQDSVRAGIDALPTAGYLLVHDGARPLVNEALIEAACLGAFETGAAICAMPVADTIKRSQPDGTIRGTVSREALWLAQTPQAFRRDLLLRAHQASDEEATDDAALIERLGEPVRLVTGSSYNLKVTTPTDLKLAEALLRVTRNETA